MAFSRTYRSTTLLVSIMTGILSLGCEAHVDGGESLLVQHELNATSQLGWSATAAMAASDSCDEALERLKHSVRVEMLAQAELVRRDFLGLGGHHGGGFIEPMPVDDFAGDTAIGAEGPASAGSAGPSQVSDTNVQVQGVDEADLVKTDAEFIYTLSGKDLVIVAAWPADDMIEVGRIALPGQPSSLYLHDGQVAVLSHVYDQSEIKSPALLEAERRDRQEKLQANEESHSDIGMMEDGDMAIDGYYHHAYKPMTLLSLVNISNPTSPEVIDQQVFEGELTGTRRIGSKIYLIQNTYTDVQGLRYWPNVGWDASIGKKLAAVNAMVDANLEVIDALELSDFMPNRYSLGDDEMVIPESKTQIASCDRVFSPAAHTGSNLTTVLTYDIRRPTLVDGLAVPGNWGTLYTSHKGIYVAANNHTFHWMWLDGSMGPNAIMTQIHKFGISETTGRIDYEGSGSVQGRVLNQFSLDEHDDHLRVATTTPDTSWRENGKESESHVFVLADMGDVLETVGHVDGLGIDERIYSVRFMGDRGYVVTFRQVDPLYVLDLSQPRAPRVTGELKIPGYSSYMHPLDADHLLTIGRDATDTGQVRGLQFQIFDVSDPAEPKLAQKTILGDSWSGWSEAEYDHHAFNYFAAKGLLALPISGWMDFVGHDGFHHGQYRSQLFLFDVDVNTGVLPVGAVSHQSLLDAAHNNSESDCFYYYGYEATIQRSVFMDDFIYSISSVGIRAHNTEALSEGSVSDVILLDEDMHSGYYNCGF